MRRTFLALTMIVLAHPAWADVAGAPPPPLYVAPLSQATQTTYVPQSVALSGPEEITPEDDRRAPMGYTTVRRARLGLLIGGGVTLGVSYFYSAMFAAGAHDAATYSGGYSSGTSNPELQGLWIPLVGPFLEAGRTNSAVGRVMLGCDGIAQATGAIMLYYGLTTKKRVFVRNDLVGSLQVAPMAGSSVSGMVLTGRF